MAILRPLMNSEHYMSTAPHMSVAPCHSVRDQNQGNWQPEFIRREDADDRLAYLLFHQPLQMHGELKAPAPPGPRIRLTQSATPQMTRAIFRVQWTYLWAHTPLLNPEGHGAYHNVSAEL